MHIGKKSIITIVIIFVLFQRTIEFYLNTPLISFIDEAIVLFFAVYAFFSIIYHKSINKKSLYFLISILVFLFIGMLSFKVNGHGSLKTALSGAFLVVKFMILVISIMNIRINKSTIDFSVKVMQKIALINSFFVIINFISPNVYHSIFQFVYIDQARFLKFGGAMGLFVHPGISGWFSLLIAISFLSIYSSKPSSKSIFFVFYYCLIALMSLRVKVIIGIIASLMFYLIFISNTKTRARNIVLSFVPVMAFMFFFQNMIIENVEKYILNSSSISASAESSARASLLENSYRIVADYFPLGVGFSKYGSWFARIRYSEFYYYYGMNKIYGLTSSDPKFATDTYWPSIMGETGFLGTVIYVSTLLVMFVVIFRKVKNNKDEKNYSYYISLFAILIFLQALLESFGEAIFNSNPQNIIIGIILGIALSNNVKESE